MKELSYLVKSLWVAIASWSSLIGMWLSLILIGGVVSILIGFKIFAIWVFNMAIVVYLIVRDEYRSNKKRKAKRRD